MSLYFLRNERKVEAGMAQKVTQMRPASYTGRVVRGELVEENRRRAAEIRARWRKIFSFDNSEAREARPKF